MVERAREGMNEAGSDNSVMLRVRDGRLEELGILFERHHVRLLSFFMKMTGDRSVSEDLVQESFLRIWRYRDGFRTDQGDFAMWMYGLARRIGADHFRTSARARLTELNEGLAGDVPSAFATIDAEESARLLRRSLLELPSEQREVLVLHRFHFRKFSEVAEILGCSTTAAKTRAHRALKDLRRIYLRLQGQVAP